ncbi:hypothetical protein [Absidia glauca]|uniref:HSF-type DNA-binding domain-containing protein n=1 Tax=Absidia glauca TaxID=4829 RepID=A0A168SU31_ABSGL|nr:hypothetical protein [Absidia glauca]
MTTVPVSSFDIPDTSFVYDESAYRHPLSPEDCPESSPPLSWDMGVYACESNRHDSITSATESYSPKRSQKRGVSTFITKLYGMVSDRRNQPLISWNPSGSSFLVCNATRFAQEVLPEHFKHRNFSSFVRQLNMYGFHKINKSLRGQRGSNENEIWEFSHGKFIYGRPDLLEGIKRKAMDSELLRRETGDIQASFARVQLSQSDLLQQFNILQDNFSTLLQSFEELKKTQLQQQIILRRLAETSEDKPQLTHPNVLVTSPQWQYHNNNAAVTSMYPIENMNMAHLEMPCMPPSPAPSNSLGHSRESSMTGDLAFARDPPKHLELAFSS